MDVKSMATGVSKWFSKNLPSIVTGVGIIGFATTVYLSMKAAPKLKEELDTAKEIKGEELGTKEKIKIAAPICCPMIIAGTASIACFIFADRANLKRNAAAIAAYQISESALRNLQTAATKTVGEKTTKEILNKADGEDLRHKPPVEQQIIITGNGDQLCYDTISGRYFRSTIEKIRQAQNTINSKLINENTVSLNDFYYEIGIPQIDVGDQLGWNMLQLGDKLDIRFSTHLTSSEDNCPYGEGQAVLTISYKVAPTYWYSD